MSGVLLPAVDAQSVGDLVDTDDQAGFGTVRTSVGTAFAPLWLRYEVEATGGQAGPHTAACSTNCADQFANAALAEHCAWGCESYSHIQSSTCADTCG